MRAIAGLLALTATGAIGLGAPAAAEDPGDAQVEKLVESEELILRLAPFLSDLGSSVENLRVPDHHSAALFASRVEVIDIARASSAARIGGGLVARETWQPASEPRKVDCGDLALWGALLEQVDYFERAGFSFVDGDLEGGPSPKFTATLGFSGLARTLDGEWVALSAQIETEWHRSPALVRVTKDLPPWQVTRWEVAKMSAQRRSRGLLFRDVVPEALPDDAVRKRAQGSLHEDHLLALARDVEGFAPPNPYFLVKPTDWQPGVSIVDVDRDGLDDVYVMDRWGANLLLRNRGDGTFEDVAPKLGLDVVDHSSSGVFADFDNDGDVDLFLGRTLVPSMYLENRNGRFVDRTRQSVTGPLPALVTSVSAVDYNGDGLLDVYFSTYAADLMELKMTKAADPVAFLSQFLPVEQARRLARDYRRSHKYLGRAGPPNVLLVNRGGGRFAPAPEGETLAVWRNTFQSTWSDFDGDGDADLYVANDFSTNNLFRNDGDGRFVDITEASQTADIGFGMGASFGDYDNDGRQDLYVSNMYSKAGRRITGKVSGLDPRFANMARGNTLFRNAGERFDKVSGLERPKLQVEKSGWSWGGQFVDVDNDGYLDIYAASGMYTAPEEFAIPGADL